MVLLFEVLETDIMQLEQVLSSLEGLCSSVVQTSDWLGHERNWQVSHGKSTLHSPSVSAK